MVSKTDLFPTIAHFKVPLTSSCKGHFKKAKPAKQQNEDRTEKGQNCSNQCQNVASNTTYLPSPTVGLSLTHGE